MHSTVDEPECHSMDNFVSNENSAFSVSGPNPTQKLQSPTRSSRSSMTSWVTSFDHDDFEDNSEIACDGDDVTDAVRVRHTSNGKSYLKTSAGETPEREHLSESRIRTRSQTAVIENGPKLKMRPTNSEVDFHFLKNFSRTPAVYSDESESSDQQDRGLQNGESIHEPALEGDDQVDKVRNKLLSMWNNMKYGKYDNLDFELLNRLQILFLMIVMDL